MNTLTFLLAPLLLAQMPTEKPGDRLIHAYLDAQARRLEATFLPEVKTAADWDRLRPRYREQFLDMLGLHPPPEKTPLKATVTGTLEFDDFVIEKVHFQSKPGLYVTGNLYRPKKPAGKLPTVLYVCGHSGRGRDGNKSAFTQHGVWFARNGYVCLLIDTLQLGELWGVHHGTYGRPYNHLKAYGINVAEKDAVEGRWWWWSAGYTPAGVECWNGIRAIDYLIGRPDVDAEKIAVTGISGGGAATYWIAAADERVKVAVPVSGMADLEEYVAKRIVNGHCDCMFLYNNYQWNWTNIAALVAPRPQLFANSDRDTIFPMAANERVRLRMERLYGLYGAKTVLNNWAVCVVPGGHADRLELRIMAYRWINRHLKGDNGDVQEAPSPKIDGKDLRVFPGDFPADAINNTIDQTFVPRANVKAPAGKAEFAEWKTKLVAELKERVFRGWPEGGKLTPTLVNRTDSGTAMRMYDTVPAGGPDVRRFSADAGNRESDEVLIVANPGDLESPVADWAGSFISGRNWAMALPRGIGEYAWTMRNPPNTVERSMALLGRTADSGRVWDVSQLAGNCNGRIVGRGPAGIIAAYAALFSDKVDEVVVIDPPTSHMQGPYFLSILRVCDIPDALGALAPKKLTIVTQTPEAFEKTRQFYKAAGAEDKLTIK
jgi:dienelactone hydrolase